MGFYRVAVATSDGENVDLHFGHATEFAIFRVNEEDGSVEEEPERKVQDACSTCPGSPGEGASAGDDPMNAIVKTLQDTDYVLAARIGPHAVKALSRYGITAYDVVLPIDQALTAIQKFRKRSVAHS